MKVWEVELKEENPQTENYAKAPIADTIQVAAVDYDLAARNAMEQSEGEQVIVTSVKLIAETTDEE